MILDSCSKNEEEIENKKHKCKRFSAKKLEQTYALLIINKRAQRALGRSPEEKVKGQGEAIIL